MNAQDEIKKLRKEVEQLKKALEDKQQTPPAREVVVDPVPNLAQTLLKDSDFITDLCRFSEGSLAEKFIRRKYGNLDDATWARLGESDELISAVELEKTRRLRSGACARERAQVLFADTPAVMGKILQDDNASPRHRNEAAREIRTSASVGPDTAAGDRIVIEINLGTDEKITIEGEPRKANPNDSIIDVTPQKALEDDWKR